MQRFFISILFSIYDYLRYKINLPRGKNIDKSLFNKLNDNLKKNLIVIKKECKENLLIASFVHQAGYIYSDCLIANYLSEIKNLNIIGLMDENDEQTKGFFNCFNSKKNIFLTKQKIILKVKYVVMANKILRKYKNVDEFLKFKLNGIAIGEAVYDHYIRNSSNPSTNYLSYKFLNFLAEALYVNDFSKEFFKKNKINYMVMSEKQFIPSIIVFQNALKAKVKVISRVAGPKKIGITMSQSFNEKNDLSRKLEKKLINKFYSKNNLKYSNMGFNYIKQILDGRIRNPDHTVTKKIKNDTNKVNQFYKALNLDPSKKTCFVFSHNFLDGVLAGKKIHIFNDYLSWLRETLNFINKLDDNVNWIIKEHPSNYGFSKLKTTTKIEFDKIISSNKKNIKIFPTNFSPSLIKEVADCVVSLAGTCGIEYTCFGIHSINSACIYYSENGFTNDYRNKNEYFNLLKNLRKVINKKLSKNQIYKARVHYYLLQILTKYEHPLLYNFDITRNLNDEKFFNMINKLIYKHSKDKDNFKKFFTYQLNNNDKHLINNFKL